MTSTNPTNPIPSHMPSPSASSIPSSSSSPYPYATAPDIIRAHQKDAYFAGVLTLNLADLHRRLLGARSAHAWTSEHRTAADLLYLSLTTLLGNRTLGEEYCDLVQVAPSAAATADPGEALTAATPELPLLPTLPRRAAYIASVILLPYTASRLLPRLRGTLRSALEARLAHLHKTSSSSSSSTSTTSRTKIIQYRLLRYLLAHLTTLTSGAQIQALALVAFYFGGAYYTLSKRALGLRYVFTRAVDTRSADRAGYEVLGVLLGLQLAVQGYLHIRTTLGSASGDAGGDEIAAVEARVRERVRLGGVDVSLDHEHSYTANNELLLDSGGGGGAAGTAQSKVDIGLVTHTAVLKGARFDLHQGGTMRWIKGDQQRKCTLCLEEMKDPAATQCGHVFCWTCIGDWIREKPECPLCRREAMVQHILPLRTV